jgi:PleD family two-component response regulator
LVARLGEQVFGLLVVGLDPAQSTQFCEQIRADVAEMRVCTGDGETFITVSVGLAEIYGLETFDNYLNAAEQFLFMSKSYGRNRVFSDHTIALQIAA